MTTAEKLFTVAGTATDKGNTKVRFANDLVARIKILNKSGCTDINLVELPNPMTKVEALKYLQSLETFTGSAAVAISEKLAEKLKLAKKAEFRVAVKSDVVVQDNIAQAESAAQPA